jgi:REP element-mobilizing transposase RayT
MSTGYQIEDQFGIYFITTTVVDWVDVFTRQAYRDIVVGSLNYCCEHKGLKIYAYVIMSNHLHMIVRSDPGKLSDTLRDFKRFTATHIIEAIKTQPESRREWMLHRFKWHGDQNIRNTDNQFWIQDNHPEVIYSSDFFMQKLNYIHENPVRAGIVDKAEDYLYSSARTLILNKKGLIPITEN